MKLCIFLLSPYLKVKLRILESSNVVEKVVSRGELMDFLQQKHHHVERADSMEAKEPNR